MAEHDRNMHITETPDTSHIKNIDVTHEKSDVQISGIAKFIIGLTILAIVTHIGVWGMFLALQKSETRKEGQQHRSPLAMTGEERLPPEPRLQSAPGFANSLEKPKPEEHQQPAQLGGAEAPRDALWEIRALHEQWKYVLEHGPTDANGQPYGMPIEQAKEEAVKQLSAKKTADGRPQETGSRR